MSSHLTNIPEAVRIAASGDPSIDPGLKQQAIEYIQKVKELSEETWQDCLALYLQGAGAPGPSSPGKDGKEKLGSDLRMFCEQVVDLALIHKSESIPADHLRAMYDALVDFVKVEWIEGPCEGNQSFLRNKLAYTLAHLFVNTFPTPITNFLHPFFALLAPPDPSSSKQNFHPPLLAMRLLSEISLEVHDTTIRATRDYNAARQQKDGTIRDSIRTTGDERLAVDGLLGLAQKGLDVVESGSGDRNKWIDVTSQALKTLASWIPWIDLSITLTPDTLAFYHRLLRQPVGQLRTASANILKVLVGKKIKSPSERLQVLRILDVVSVLTPLEEATRGIKDDEEIIEFRAAIGGILQQYGSDLIGVIEHAGDDLMPVNEGESVADLQKEAENMMINALPLLLQFLSDRQTDVPLSVNLFVVDILRLYKKWHVPRPPPTTKAKMPPPPQPTTPLTEERRNFLSSLLDICVRQLAWPDDAEWEAPGGEDPDPDDDMAKFWTLRMYCSNHIESISALDKTLHTQIVANIVGSTLTALQSGGPSAISWQQAELALHLVYTFGELVKNNSIAAFFELPAEISSKSGRDRVRRISINKAHMDSAMSSGRTTPTSDLAIDDISADVIPGVYYGGKDKIDYSQFPLTTLGTLLDLCNTAGIVNYPHPSVPLMYFRIAVRYVEFWKAREDTIQPMFEAMLDQRGIHHPDETVRRRSFWEFTRFVRECKTEMNPDMAAPILESMRDLLVINPVLVEADTPDEDVLLKAATTPSYLTDQLHLFEAAGSLVYITRSDTAKHMALLEALAGPLMAAIGDGLQRPTEPLAILQVHHYLMALGNFAKGFPSVSDKQIEALPYTPAFKQMTEALLEALNVMKTQRIVRDSARFAFSQFVTAIGSTIAELVPRFVSSVVTEFVASELVDFILFLNLLMHRLKNNAFETMDMLLLPLLSRIFAVLRAPITGTDAASIHSRLKDAYLLFFGALMNANLDGVFITDRNKPEFENVLSELLALATNISDPASQRQAISFFARSIIAWGSTNAPSVFADSAASEMSKAVAAGTAQATNQHLITKEERAARAFPGYEGFIYQRLLPLCFEIPANPKFKVGSGQPVLHELSMVLRNTVAARGQEAVDYMLNDLLPKLQCPPDVAEQLVGSLRTQQSRDFRKTFVDFIKALRGETGKR